MAAAMHGYTTSAAPDALDPELAGEGDRYDIVADVRTFRSLKPHWDDLYAKSAGNYFSQSFEWCSTSWEIVSAPRGHRLHCVVGRQGDRVVLIWPLVIHRRGLWSIAHPLGWTSTEYSSVLVEEDSKANGRVAAAWRVLQASCPCDVISLPFIRAESHLSRVVSAARTRGACQMLPTSAVVRNEYHDWISYSRSRKPNQRHDLSRRRRRLSESGKVTFEPIVDVDQYVSTLEWIFYHKMAALGRNNRSSAWADTESYRNLLIALSGKGSPCGKVVISVLKLNNAVIAAGVSRIDRSRVELVIHTFDRAYEKYAPGGLLLQDCLQWAFERGLDYDLRIGNDRYKEHWLTTRSEVASWFIVNSIWGHVFMISRRLWQIVHRVRRFFVVHLRGRSKNRQENTNA